MDGLIVLGVLLVVGIPILAIVGFFTAMGAKGGLRELEVRLRAIELRLVQMPPSTAGPAAAAPEPLGPDAAASAPPEASAEAPETPPPAATEPSPPPPEEPPTAAAPTPPPRSFEERFGTQWVVWVGGLALALGGVFLVRYTIEEGLIGPGVRIFLGALLAAGLIAAGEWARRTERLADLSNLPGAHIPSILTAAGTTVAYSVVYAAYALYDFLPAAIAFVLLGVVALATLGAALLHGPALAALGLVGAYLAPLLVSTARPNYWALYLYLAVVGAASFTLARIRLWRWLAITAVAFGTLWMFPGIGELRTDVLMPHAFHAVAGFSLVAGLIVSGFLYGPPAEPGRIDAISSAALAAFVFCSAALVIATHHDAASLSTFVLLVAGTLAIAWQAESASVAVPAAALLAAFVMAHWSVSFAVEHLIAPAGPTAGTTPEPDNAFYGLHLVVGGALATLFGIAGFFAQGRSERPVIPMLWAAAGVLTPLAILVALYSRIAAFERSIPFAALALLIAALYAFATETLDKRPVRPGLAAAGAIFAAGAIAALALTLTFALEKGWLTVALALMVPGIAYVAEKRPLPILRWAAAVLVLLVLARIAWEPRIVGRDVGATPIFNWLLYGYGGPAAAFWVAGHLLRRRADDVPARMVETGAILFTVLLAFLEIRHFMNDGDVYRETTGLGELALDVWTGLAMAIGLERVRARTGNIVHNIGAFVLAAGSACAIVLGLWFIENPLLTSDPVGGPFLNLILLGYGVPAALTAALALITRGTRPWAYRVTGAVLAVGLALLYLTLEITRLYHGPILTRGITTDAEQYTYSAVWLTFGVVLLFVGIALRSQPVRLASAAVVLITVGKVFLIDLAGLTGAYRAFSFIGLGLVLVGIGWIYQRLLFPRPAPA